MTVATYAIGDVQGCYDALRRLLDEIRFDDRTDRLWFVGDLVNRGPKSLEALRFVRGLGDSAITVLGNHDLHLLAAHADRTQRRKSDTFDDVLAAPDGDALIDWLAWRPLFHRDDALGFALVHAGIPVIWSFEDAAAHAREVESALRGARRDELLRTMYGNRPAEWRADLRGAPRLRTIVNYLTRMRAVRGVCELDLEFKESAHDLPAGTRAWFEDYRRQPPELDLVFGHWATLDGRCDVPRIHALDTGCVWGGRLTALRLVDLQRFSVASRI